MIPCVRLQPGEKLLHETSYACISHPPHFLSLIDRNQIRPAKSNQTQTLIK